MDLKERLAIIEEKMKDVEPRQNIIKLGRSRAGQGSGDGLFDRRQGWALWPVRLGGSPRRRGFIHAHGSRLEDEAQAEDGVAVRLDEPGNGDDRGRGEAAVASARGGRIAG